MSHGGSSKVSPVSGLSQFLSELRHEESGDTVVGWNLLECGFVVRHSLFHNLYASMPSTLGVLIF